MRIATLTTPLTLIAASALAMACADSSTVTSPTASHVAGARGAGSEGNVPRYEIRDLQGDLAAAGFVAGFNAFDIDNSGRVAGSALLPSGVQHGFMWERGQATDVGSFGGPALNSQAAGRTGRDELSILSEIAAVDPLNEDFCGLFSSRMCRAGVWRNGVIAMLPTLGGNSAAALTTNIRGQIVGVAEDGVVDNTCMLPQKSHFHAAVWERGQIQKLPPLPGDQVSIGLRINDHGQAVGTSGLCSNTRYGGFGIGPHAVLWDNGVPRYLGNLGDPSNGVAASINNQGEVVGGAGYPDGTLHPFLWTEATGMRDLGLLSADPNDSWNTPFQINDRGEMVGASCRPDFSVCRGYLWRNGAFTDLNDLVPADSPLYIILPLAINQVGEIAGLAVVKSTGEPHIFLARPASGAANSSLVDAGRATSASTRRVMLDQATREVVRRRLGHASTR